MSVKNKYSKYQSKQTWYFDFLNKITGGYIKTEAQAQSILLIVVVLALATSVLIWSSGTKQTLQGDYTPGVSD